MSKHPIRGTRVLVVEDHTDTREMYAAYLRHHGCEVFEAADGLEAVERASSVRPDIIVMDMGLPGLDGREVTRRLHADRATRDAPVVALTGDELDDSERRAREAGCAGFLVKPCLPDTLAGEIVRVLNDRQQSTDDTVSV